MAIYFAFTDEVGTYRRSRSKKFLRAHPYYARATVVIAADEWKRLETNYLALKQSRGLPADKEIKWSFANSLHKMREAGKRVTQEEPFYFLRDYDVDELRQFLADSLALLSGLTYARALFTVTCNRTCAKIAEQRLLRMHLQEMMQRIQMDMEGAGDALCVCFVDTVSKDSDNLLREAYSDLYQSGDRYKSYSQIKDSLNLEHSHHSVGIQMADFLAGAFVANLKGYAFGEQIYRDTLRRLIRRSDRGCVAGYGVREVPGNRELRAALAPKCP